MEPNMCKYCKINEIGLAEYACPDCPTAPKNRRKMSTTEVEDLIHRVKEIDLGATGRSIIRARAIELVLSMTDQQLEAALLRLG